MFNQEDDVLGQVKTFYRGYDDRLISYGDPLSYPSSVNNNKFWRKLEKQLETVPEALFKDCGPEYPEVLWWLTRISHKEVAKSRPIWHKHKS